ncbi:hypothetical protein MBLNU230_g0913t1 [Neophaeotheca triangularis]
MFRNLALATGLLALTNSVVAVDQAVDAGLNTKLAGATSQLERMAMLDSDEDWIFDFTKQEYYSFAPGGVVNMNAATFPAAVSNGLTLAMLNLGPCAMLPPHYHPRASNYVVAVEGNTTTYMYEENGAELVTTNLQTGQATIFPQGSMHMMANTGCEKSQLVSALSSSDAGTNNIGNVFTQGFPADLVNAAFGSQFAGENAAENMVPFGTGANYGTAECLKRCGIEP